MRGARCSVHASCRRILMVLFMPWVYSGHCLAYHTPHHHPHEPHPTPRPSDVERAKLALAGATTAAGVHTSVDAGTPRSRRIIQLMEDARQLAVAARVWLIAGEIARNQCGQLAIQAGAATGPERATAVRQVEETLQHAEACLASAKPWAPGMLYKHVLARTKEVRRSLPRSLPSHVAARRPLVFVSP